MARSPFREAGAKENTMITYAILGAAFAAGWVLVDYLPGYLHPLN